MTTLPHNKPNSRRPQTARRAGDASTGSLILVDRFMAAEMLGSINVRTFEARVRDGVLPKPRRLGRRVLWLVRELHEAAEALPVSGSTRRPPVLCEGLD